MVSVYILVLLGHGYFFVNVADIGSSPHETSLAGTIARTSFLMFSFPHLSLKTFDYIDFKSILATHLFLELILEQFGSWGADPYAHTKKIAYGLTSD